MADIKPVDGDVEGTARLLLALVDANLDTLHPRDVSITHGPDGLVFVVPDALAALFEGELVTATDDADETEGDTEGEELDAAVTDETEVTPPEDEVAEDEEVPEKAAPVTRVRKIVPKAQES